MIGGNGFAGLARIVSVLLLASHAAGAEPARHGKHRRPAATTKKPVEAAQPAPEPTATESAPAATEAPPDEAPPRAEATAPVKGHVTEETLAPDAAGSAAAIPRRKAPDTVWDETSALDEALARREAARLASGRFEVAIAVGLDLGRRAFTYSDPIGAPPQPYRLSGVPLASLGLEVYPLASSGVPVLRDLGLRGHFSRAFAADSSTSAGDPIRTSWTRFGGELRQRFLVPGPHAADLGASVGIDASYFDLSTKGNVGALVPAARTVSLRFGLDGRVFVAWRLSLSVGGGYLATLSRGEIYDHFRASHVAGVDGALGGALRLGPGVELRLDARYTRYFSRFAPEVGDAAVAGGALDEQLQVGVGVRYAH